MFMRRGTFTRFGRATMLATATAVALTTIVPTMASAGTAPAKAPIAAKDQGMTDISSRARGGQRVYRHRGGGGGGAAAAAAFAGIVGTGLAIAASQNRRDYYDDGYYGRPAYYGPGQGYYGGGYGGPSYGGW